MRSIYQVAFSLCLMSALSCPLDSLAEEGNKVSAKDKLIVETVLRIENFDLETSAPAKAAVLKYLRAEPGTDR